MSNKRRQATALLVWNFIEFSFSDTWMTVSFLRPTSYSMSLSPVILLPTRSTFQPYIFLSSEQDLKILWPPLPSADAPDPFPFFLITFSLSANSQKPDWFLYSPITTVAPFFSRAHFYNSLKRNHRRPIKPKAYYGSSSPPPYVSQRGHKSSRS